MEREENRQRVPYILNKDTYAAATLLICLVTIGVSISLQRRMRSLDMHKRKWTFENTKIAKDLEVYGI